MARSPKRAVLAVVFLGSAVSVSASACAPTARPVVVDGSAVGPASSASEAPGAGAGAGGAETGVAAVSPELASASPPASACTTVGDLHALTILGGRPYGVFAEGVRRLDRPNDPVAPVGNNWPRIGGDARSDRVSALAGRWPDRLVVQLDRQKGNFPGSDAFVLSQGSWKTLRDPPDVTGYLQVLPAGQGRIVGIGITGATTRLVVLAGPDRFPGAGPSAGNGNCAVHASSLALAVSPSGRVAATRARCHDGGKVEPPLVEVFDEKLRSQSRTPLEPAEGIFLIAWLNDETVLAGFNQGSPTGPGRLVAITAGKRTEMTLPPRDQVTGFSAAADGGLLVATAQHLLRVAPSGAFDGAPIPWASFVQLDPIHRAFVEAVAIGEDGARYLQINENTGSFVLRCPSTAVGSAGR